MGRPVEQGLVNAWEEKSVARLSVRLLGPFKVALGGQPVTGFESDKVRALLAFLGVEGERLRRLRGDAREVQEGRQAQQGQVTDPARALGA